MILVILRSCSLCGGRWDARGVCLHCDGGGCINFDKHGPERRYCKRCENGNAYDGMGPKR